ncbi:hypothetical protein HLB42_21560 (plasmid) [Deinococcus sp. D7000]|nr:hypothetical protein HLB42_13835 [Deinococcus sp. D7000]QLG13529.1 hypothetical protein HLB42_21560 [Deinococcus sp. D7000]
MGGKAAELARQRELEAAQAAQFVQLAPTDPIRRAKVLDGVPTPAPGNAPNGTAKKADGADGSTAPVVTDPTADSQGVPTPEHMPEVEPTVAKDSRPAKVEGAPGMSSSEAEAASQAQPDEAPARKKGSKK